MRPALIFLPTLLLAQFLTQAPLHAETAILRCVRGTPSAATAEIRYQTQPCPRGFMQSTLAITQAPTPVPAAMLVQVDAAKPGKPAKTRTPAAARRSNASAKRTVSGTGKPHRLRKLHPEAALSQPGCPATYEDGGSYVVSNRWVKTPSGSRNKAHSGMRAAWEDYKSLPTKTYLKNAGRWPKGCPP